MNSNGISYKGDIFVTRTNKTCLDWMKINSLELLFFENEVISDAKNFCRNPGGRKKKPWCFYNKNPLLWDFCSIPNCSNTILIS